MSAGKSGISSKAQLSAVQLANDQLFVSFLPELGAKMSSLKSVRSGREFLYQPRKCSYRRAAYGASFADYDTSGFDDCCPTVAECIYPGPAFRSRKMPDHGDLWSAHWDYRAGGRELFFETEGKSLPYRFRKSARLEDSMAVLTYEIENAGSGEFAFLWSAHPLLAVEASCRIVLPEKVSRLFVEWSRGERLGKFGDSCGWPVAACKDGERVDLSELRDASARTADKLFTSRLQDGTCALCYPQTKETIAFHFNPQDVPYLGIWICQGGWPSPESEHFTVGLEPCTGYPDSLREAIHRGSCDRLRPGQKKKWALSIEARSGDSSFVAR
jgi:galactose mutarotase-like enzyme